MLYTYGQQNVIFFLFPHQRAPHRKKERKKEDNILSAATMYEANLEMIS